ncbi:MAG: thiamine pyrophosphate-dependent enzyme, partial [Bacillota bacterium]
NYATTEADLIIAVGARFDDRVTGKLDKFAAEATVVHIELDPAEVSKNVEADIPVIGDAREVLQQLLPRIKEQDHELWVNQIQDWKQKHPLNYEDGDQGQIKPQYVLEKLYELTGGEALITTEVGQNQMWAAQYYKYTRPRTFISSGGLGTMGYGFPAAVGVQVGNPDRTVIDIAGDGSIQMNIQELGTISNYNLPVKVIILNNSYLGMVRQWQEFFYDRRYSETGMKPPDFRKLAEAYGIHGLSINKQDEVEAALRDMLETEGPVVLEVKIPEEENVFPMVPPGSAIVDMIGGE